MTHMDLLHINILRLKNRITCGETGLLQCSAWVALDLKMSYEQWVGTLRLADVGAAEATLRKQFRLCEQDRNACLVEDGESEQQTFYGKLVQSSGESL